MYVAPRKRRHDRRRTFLRGGGDVIARRALNLFGLPAVLLAAWWVASAGSTDFYRPPLSKILAAFADTSLGQRLADDVAPSLARLAAGYADALVTSTRLGGR